ncbi:MAG: DUF5011 domain-containing protein, partial [Chitinivibrionales bacterium]|nr:DUF5011 domain-containing protein [Chitinivibrionales bacterium]
MKNNPGIMVLTGVLAVFYAGCKIDTTEPAEADTTPPVLVLTDGPDSLIIGETWTEPGYVALDDVDGDISANVAIAGTVNTAVAGLYQLTYSVSDAAGNQISKIREILVIDTATVDTVPPALVLTPGEDTILVGGSWQEPGYTALDTEDGDLTGSVVITGSVDTAVEGAYELSYAVSDNAGNQVSKNRVVYVVNRDTTAPVIELVPGDTVRIGTSWQEPGYSASDNLDGDITARVVVSGQVDSTKAGTHSITYTVSDSAGNSTIKIRNVIVVLPSSAVAFYPFDGDALDKSGNSLHGTVIGATLAADRFGVDSNAYHFDGSGYIEVPYSSLLDFQGAFSISVWAKSDIPPADYSAAGGQGFIISMGWGGSRDYAVSTFPGAGIHFRYNDLDISDASVDIEQWHHYVMVFDGSYLSGYADGVLIDTLYTGQGTIADNPLRIGCESKNVNRRWTGSIDDVMLFDTVLTTDKIAAINGLGTIGGDTSLIADISDTSTTDTTTDTATVVRNLRATITGTAGNLQLVLSWDPVPDAFAYGVWFNQGPVVSTNDYYRVAVNNSRTFTSGELVEGKEYTFAVNW